MRRWGHPPLSPAGRGPPAFRRVRQAYSPMFSSDPRAPGAALRVRGCGGAGPPGGSSQGHAQLAIFSAGWSGAAALRRVCQATRATNAAASVCDCEVEVSCRRLGRRGFKNPFCGLPATLLAPELIFPSLATAHAPARRQACALTTAWDLGKNHLCMAVTHFLAVAHFLALIRPL